MLNLLKIRDSFLILATSMHIVGAQFVELNINSEMEEYFTLMQGSDGLTHAVLGSRVWVK